MKVNNLETYISEFCAFARSRPRSERELKEDYVNDYHIDTCAVDDREWTYETAIECKWFNDGNWIVVRGYETREAAEAGHATWCNKAKTGFQKLYDVYENKIYCKGKAESHKPIATVKVYEATKFECPLCRTRVEVSYPLSEDDTQNLRCPLCENILFLTDCTITCTSYPGRSTRTIGKK